MGTTIEQERLLCGFERDEIEAVLRRMGEMNTSFAELEDDLVEPPVSLTFDPPSLGEWVTLEMDLAAAASERGLDLTRMNNIWVRLAHKDAEESARAMHEVAEQPEELAKMAFVGYVDNVRLAMKGAACAVPGRHRRVRRAPLDVVRQEPVGDPYEARCNSLAGNHLRRRDIPR